MTPRRVLALLLVALAPALASAQNANVLVVDVAGGAGSAFTDIQTAINAAASGDIVLVRAGSYSAISIQAKSLSVVADAGAVVTVFGTSRIGALTTDQRVEVKDLQFTNLQVVGAPSTPPLVITSCAGVVWLEHVDSTAQIGYFTQQIPGLLVTDCASVALMRCTALGMPNGPFGNPGTAPGLSATSSTLAIFDGTFQGSPAPPSVSGGAGATFIKCFAFASATLFQGGQGGSSISLAGNGGTGVYVASDGFPGHGELVSLGCTFAGGPGGIGPYGGNGFTGPPSVTEYGGTITTIPGVPRHFEIESPARELQSATLHFWGLPGENACALLSDLSDPVFIFPLFAGAFCVSLGNVNALLFDVIPPSGKADVSIPMPDFLPSLMGGRIYFQSFFFDPAVTYVVLGPPSLFVLLDSGL